MTEKAGMSSHLEQKINLLSAWIEGQMAYSGLPGSSIGVLFDQELIWSKGFGYANIEKKIPASPKTRYRIASISKLFTSTAILQLRDAGKLQLDDPVRKHLPWFEIKNRFEDAPPILIRNLITHTSGLPRESAFPYWTTADYPSYEQVMQALPNQNLVLRPDTQWKYSNLALALAGMIVSTVSGISWEEYIETNILGPLGMADTFARTIPMDHPDLAVGYGRRLPDGTRAVRPFEDCKGISPAANIATNIEDLAKFAMLQFRSAPLGGRQILSVHTLREMHTPHWVDPDWQGGWGWGFYITRVKGKSYHGHGGGLMGFRTNLAMSLPDKIGVLVFTNADDGLPALVAEKAFELLTEEILKAYAPKPVQKDAEPNWSRYVGKYRSAWGDTQIMVYQDGLVAIDPSLADPVLDMAKLIPVAEHTFRMEMKNGFGAFGEPAVFELDENGKVVRLKEGENYSYPVEHW